MYGQMETCNGQRTLLLSDKGHYRIATESCDGVVNLHLPFGGTAHPVRRQRRQRHPRHLPGKRKAAGIGVQNGQGQAQRRSGEVSARGGGCRRRGDRGPVSRFAGEASESDPRMNLSYEMISGKSGLAIWQTRDARREPQTVCYENGQPIKRYAAGYSEGYESSLEIKFR